MRDVRKINLFAMSGFEQEIVVAANNANILIVTTLMTTLKAGQASAGTVTATEEETMKAGQASAGAVTATEEETMPNRSTNNGSTNKGSSRVAHQVHLLR